VNLSAAQRVIDTHVHVWEHESSWMGWLKDRPDHWDVVRRDFTWNELRDELDQAGVAELILMQACTTPEETRMLLAIADRQPSILGVVGWATLKSVGATERDLASFAGPGVEKLVGIRNNHGWTPDGDVIATPEALDSCRLLAERGLTLDLHFSDYQDLPLAAKLAEQVPAGTYIIDHLGRPALDMPEAFAPWAAAMTVLSKLPNIYVKYSGWATFVRRTRAADVQRYIDFALEAFGAERIMFASNWPVALVAGSYRDTYAATLETISHLSPTDLGMVLHGTAARCYLKPWPGRSRNASARGFAAAGGGIGSDRASAA
jgi:L-fuconolactonase